jgi:polar amino acid transport system substrate-binding protein
MLQFLHIHPYKPRGGSMKNMIKMMIIPFFFLALVGTATAADNSWQQVQTKGEFRIGLDDDFPPMAFRKADGKLYGFDIDFAEAVGKKLGLKIVWVPTAWKGVIPSLYADKFDAIWNGMTITPEREEKVSFSNPYMMDGQVAAVTMSNTAIKAPANLGGKIVGIQQGSTAMVAIEALPNKPAELKQYETNPKAMLDLESGRLDCVVIDNLTARDIISKKPGTYKILPQFITKAPFGVAFRKGDDSLRQKIQQAITKLIEDGTTAKISRKWFAEDLTNPATW